MWRTSGMRLMIHSPMPRTDAPTQDDMKTPTKNMKVTEVMKPRPGDSNEYSGKISWIGSKHPS